MFGGRELVAGLDLGGEEGEIWEGRGGLMVRTY